MTSRERKGDNNMVLKIKERSPKTSRTKTPSINELRKKLKGSPKGKRKLNFHNKGPLSGKTFYLDLMGYRNLAQLKKIIKKLNGVIEEFFHKDVMYLVTNRDIGKSPSSQSVCSPATPSPFNVSQSSSVRSNAAPSPMSTDSPQSIENRQNKQQVHNTRGQAIFKNVSAMQKKGTSNVLTNANTWGVNVYHVDHVVKWCSKLLAKTNTTGDVKADNGGSSRANRATQGKTPKVICLQDTYLKIEDLSYKYRPLVHEFKKWPEMVFNSSIVSPFDEVSRRRSSEYKAAKQNNNQDSKLFKRIVGEKVKHGYCECCEVRYNDLYTHLKGEQHQKFAKTISNYTSLDKAINTGPILKDFLNEVCCKKTELSCANETVKNEPIKSCNDTIDDEVFLISSPVNLQQVQKKEKRPSCQAENEESNKITLRLHTSSTKSTTPNVTRMVKINDVKDFSQKSEAGCKIPTNHNQKASRSNETTASPAKSGPSSPIQSTNMSIKERSSSRRKRKAMDVQLSPILQCDSAGGQSVSASVDDAFLPSGLPVYSSVGSSLGDIFKDINNVIRRIESNTDVESDERKTCLSSPDKQQTNNNLTTPNKSNQCNNDNMTVMSSGPVTRYRSNNSQTSPINTVTNPKLERSLKVEAVDNNIPVEQTIIVSADSENELIHVKQEPIQTRRHSVRSVSGNDSPLSKRKRSPNQEPARRKARKCKRLMPDLEDSEINDDFFCANIAERVKLQRALFESLQDSLNSSSGEIKGLCDSSFREKTCYKGTSPLTEVTNQYPSRRERAKSEGMKKTISAFSKNKSGHKKATRTPKSACLTANDPFSFQDV